MPDYAGEKTLEPTPHRRQQARREGHVAKSHDLGSAAMLLAGLAVLVMLGGGLVGFLVEYCRSQLGGQPWLTADAEFVVGQWNATLWALGRYLLPILGLLCLAGVAVNVLQIGFLFLPQRLAFDLARLDPLQGFRRIFSAANLVQLGFGVVKLVVVLAVACVVLYGQRDAILGLTESGPVGHRRADGADRVLDRAEGRRGPVGPGDAGLRLPVVAARAGPEDDAARAARGVAKPRRQSAGHRPAKAGAARPGVAAAAGKAGSRRVSRRNCKACFIAQRHLAM